mgnify:CR=1 FL=1
MKKLSMVAVALMVLAGVAYASSIGVPWFIDNSSAASGYPPASGITTLIYLKNNTAEDIECDITYFSPNGTNLTEGASAPTAFVVPASSTVGFRPVAYDPATVTNGQESATGVLVPDRPRYVSEDATSNLKNGAAVIEWNGGANDIQGMVATLGVNGFAYAHLLPPGE